MLKSERRTSTHEKWETMATPFVITRSESQRVMLSAISTEKMPSSAHCKDSFLIAVRHLARITILLANGAELVDEVVTKQPNYHRRTNTIPAQSLVLI